MSDATTIPAPGPPARDSSSETVTRIGDAGATTSAPAVTVEPRAVEYQGAAHNLCPTCGFKTAPGVTEAKFCPWCGPELLHIPPARRCAACQEQVIFKGAKFCAWCGKELG